MDYLKLNRNRGRGWGGWWACGNTIAEIITELLPLILSSDDVKECENWSVMKTQWPPTTRGGVYLLYPPEINITVGPQLDTGDDWMMFNWWIIMVSVSHHDMVMAVQWRVIGNEEEFRENHPWKRTNFHHGRQSGTPAKWAWAHRVVSGGDEPRQEVMAARKGGREAVVVLHNDFANETDRDAGEYSYRSHAMRIYHGGEAKKKKATARVDKQQPQLVLSSSIALNPAIVS